MPTKSRPGQDSTVLLIPETWRVVAHAEFSDFAILSSELPIEGSEDGWIEGWKRYILRPRAKGTDDAANVFDVLIGKGFELEDHAITDGHGSDYSASSPNAFALSGAVLHTAGARPNNHSLENYCLGLFRDSVQKADEAKSIFRERCTGVLWEISTTSNYALCSLMYLASWDSSPQRVP